MYLLKRKLPVTIFILKSFSLIFIKLDYLCRFALYIRKTFLIFFEILSELSKGKWFFFVYSLSYCFL